MAVPYKYNTPLLQFFHHLKPTHYSFSVQFQIGHSTLHTLLQPERQTQHFSLRHQDELWQIYLKSVISVQRLALFLYVDVPCGSKATKPNNMGTERDPTGYYVCFHAQTSYQATHTQPSLHVVMLNLA
jgi:hypothetical protein